MTSPPVSPQTPLAIIGMGCLFPKADGLEAYWANVKNGVDAITEIPETHWSLDDYYSDDPKTPDHTYGRRGGFLSPHNFDPLAYGIPPNALEATDTSQLLGMATAEQALRDAGYQPGRPFNRERVAVILGVTGALELVIPLGARLGHPHWRKAMAEAGIPAEQADQAAERMANSYVEWQENSFPGLLGNVVAGRISKHLDLGGTNCVVDAACASSLSAMHLAALELASGKADIVVTGGVDTFNDIFMYMCFSKTPALSPTGNAKPFDHEGDGTILGEGLGVVVLKRLEDAERDGDRVYAVLKGIGSSSDGKGDAIYAPNAKGQTKALREAYAKAGVSPQTVELVEAHGTGTKRGDAVEVHALKEVYGEPAERGPWCALGSVKSQIGHTKAAAGAAGLIKAAMALHDKVLPPTIKVTNPQDAVKPGTTPFYVNTLKRPWLSRPQHPRRAAVSSFGFGGSNFHCVLEEYKPQKSAPSWDGNVQLFAFSADTPAALSQLLESIPAAGDWNALRTRAAESRAAFKPDAPHRLLLVAERDHTDMAKLLQSAQSRLGRANTAEPGTPAIDGVYYGTGPAAGKLAAVFPGQGAQYVGMLRDLACAFPELLDTLAEAEAVLPVFDRIYPHPKFDDGARNADEKALTATNIAQPAIGAVSLGAYRVLERFGLRAAAFAGHSYGELTALCAAGRYNPQALFALSKRRGQLMAGGGSDRGAMLAVRGSLAEIESIISEKNLPVVVANKNAPEQAVLSGTAAAIDAAVDVFKQHRFSCTKLPVAAAFHSELVADAREPFLQALRSVSFEKTSTPVYSNTLADIYPEDADAARELLASQLASPVEFVRQIEAMYAAGVRTFVEAGPGARLTGLIKAILADKPVTTVALDASNGKRDGIADLAKTLARIAAAGHSLNLAEWDATFIPEPAGQKKPRMTVPISGANYRAPRSDPKNSITLPKGKPANPKHNAPAPESPPRSEPQQQPAARTMQNETTPSQTTPGQIITDQPDSASPPLPGNPGLIGDLLRQTQESIAVLQKMHEQTAALHKQYLDGQTQASHAIQTLLQQQHNIMRGMPIAEERPTPGAPPAPPEPVVAPREPAAPEPPAAQPEPVTPEPPPDTENQGTITPILLDIVAEKTGYPAEMLELSMHLDSDLGIDSIKRVEILSALQEQLPELPAVEAEDLGKLQTLQDVINILGESAPASPSAAPSSSAPATAAATVQQLLLDIVAEKTGYPAEMLELSMHLDSDLGIDSIKRVEILSALQEQLPELPAVEAEDLGKLQTLQDVINILGGNTAPASAAQPAHPQPVPAANAPAEQTAGPLQRYVLRAVPLAENEFTEDLRLNGHGEIWITDDGSDVSRAILQRLQALELQARLIPMDQPPPSGPLQGLILIAPDDPACGEFLKQALFLAQRLAPALHKAAQQGPALLAAICRIDGAFGLRAAHGEPLSGGLAGLIKTAALEWPAIACKCCDLANNFDSVAHAASALVDELRRRGPIEVGLSPGERLTIQLAAEPQSNASQSPVLTKNDVILVTGGARGVTAAAAIALAKRYQPTLILLGRSALPEQDEAPWLKPLESEAGIKKALLERAPGKPAPREIEAQTREILARREIRHTLRQIEAAGARAIYHSVDIRDREVLHNALESLQAQSGAITAVVHGAGVLADRRIEDKTPEQVDAVYDTKVIGLCNVLDTLNQAPLKLLALFASSTARFGRAGQVDYAMANEVLNKIAQAQARRRPECRVLALNWGPWAGGMVTPALEKVFEREGVTLIGLEPGAQWFINEIESSANDVEVVVLGPGSKSPVPQAAGQAAASPLTPIAERELSLQTFPVLRSHVLDGKPVLPFALYTEWFAHAALHGNPGLRFHGLDGLRVLKGVILAQNERRTLSVHAGKAQKQGDLFTVPVELHSGGILHGRASVILAQKIPPAPVPEPVPDLGPYRHANADFYANGLLFHGPDLQGLVEVEGCAPNAITAIARTAPRPPEWIKNPLRKTWLADPLVLDCAFQMMILWSLDRHGAPSLPVYTGQYRQYHTSFPKGRLRLTARITRDSDHAARADIDVTNAATGELVAQLIQYECVIDPSLKDAFQRNTVSAEQITQG